MLNDTIYTALNVAGITGLLGTYNDYPAIFADDIIPADCIATATINFYFSDTYNGALDYDQLVYTINCRAGLMSSSQAIAAAVKTAINRVSGTDYYIGVNILPTIPPMDDRDNYNTIVEATIKKR